MEHLFTVLTLAALSIASLFLLGRGVNFEAVQVPEKVKRDEK